MSSKKRKEFPSESKECANCCAPDGQHGVTLKACTRCKATHYCGRACQTTHWKACHKQCCVKPKRVPPKPPEQKPSPLALALGNQLEYPGHDPGADGANEGAICLDPLDTGSIFTLPCTHIFYASCVEGLRSFGIKQVCNVPRGSSAGTRAIFRGG